MPDFLDGICKRSRRGPFHRQVDACGRRTRLLPLSAALLLSACAGSPTVPDQAAAWDCSVCQDADTVAGHLATVEQIASGGLTPSSTSSINLDTLQSLAQSVPTASNQLTYALALGSAGHANSDPAGAGRLVSELLNSTHDLKPAEISLAKAFLREFEARAALRASMERDRLEFAQQLKASSASEDRKVAALTMENARLKKALAEAERKLSAVAEIERSLLEAVRPATDAPTPPPQ